MNIRHLSAILFAVAFTVAAGAQGSAPPASQNGGQNSTSGPGGHGQRGGHGGGMGGGAGMMMGRGLMGTVTEVAADHYTIKTDTGDVYTVHFTADTHIFKQVAGTMRGPGQGAGAGGGARGWPCGDWPRWTSWCRHCRSCLRTELRRRAKQQRSSAWTWPRWQPIPRRSCQQRSCPY